MNIPSYIFIFVFSLLLLGGCTSFLDGSANYFTATDEGDAIKDVVSLELSPSKCYLGECYCFLCEDMSDVSWPLDLFIDSALLYGDCSFSPCTEDTFTQMYFFDSGQYVLPFLFGQGPSFLSYSDGNSYSNNSMQLAVKWLYANGNDYPIPVAEKAKCFLRHRVIPLYILYSKGKSISASRAAQVAQSFKDLGPVMITTEMNPDLSDPLILSEVKQQIIEMDSACPKCLIALGLKAGDVEGAEAVLSDESVSAKVDLVAYGLNSSFSKKCTGRDLYINALNFSNFLLQEYNKPSIWAYVLLEEGEYGECEWTAGEIQETYSLVLKYIPAFVYRGVIGMAPYSFYYYENGPLECKECAFFDKEFYPYNEKIYSWFGNVQRYYTSYGAYPVTYTNNSATDCSFGGNPLVYYGLAMSAGTQDSSGNYILEPLDYTFFRCDACLASFSGEEFPFTLTKSAGSLPENICGNEEGIIPEQQFLMKSIEIYADMHDLDFAWVKAIIWQESNFNPCAVSAAKADAPCNPYDIEIGAIKDVEDVCTFQDLSSSFQASENLYPKDPETEVEYKPCAFGLMQVIDYGYGWTKAHEPYFSHPEEVLSCTDEYNPFNPQHSICVGTAILKTYFINALEIVDNNRPGLEIDSEELEDSELADEKKQELESLEEEKRIIIAMFITSHKYYGDWNSHWISSFSNQKDQKSTKEKTCGEGKCCGNKDFLNYVGNCLQNSQGEEYYYGNQVMAKYKKIREECKYCDEESWVEALRNYFD